MASEASTADESCACKGGTFAGDLGTVSGLSVCPLFSEHLLEELALEGCSHSVLLEETLQAYPGIRYVLVEREYYCVDYRSELALTIERRHRSRRTWTYRLHLFTEVLDDSKSVLSELEAIAENDPESYVGYVVVRPQRAGMVGRSLLRPPSSHPAYAFHDGGAEPGDYGARIRTTSCEVVHICGVEFRVYGVPFMEQDGHLTVCGHATAWMAHYAAFLKGLVGRHPTGHFHTAARGLQADRAYPSTGMLDDQIAASLTALGFPTLVLLASDYKIPREVRSTDRVTLRSLFETGLRKRSAKKRTWRREGFTAEICRHLNSGLVPIINKAHHSQAVVGYLRKYHLVGSAVLRELSKPPTGLPKLPKDFDLLDDDDVVALIIHCDRDGPYRLVWVDTLLEGSIPAADEEPVILLPYPEGVWMSGAYAEDLAYATLREIGQFASPLIAGATETALSISEMTDDASIYALRAYVTNSTDFKRGYNARCPNAAAEVVSQVSLSRFVWVIEIMERDKRRKDDCEAVVGEIIIDASAPEATQRFSEEFPTADDFAAVSIIHLPGWVGVRQHPGSHGNRLRWSDVDPKYHAYSSGRWKRSNDWLVEHTATLARAKGTFGATS